MPHNGADDVAWVSAVFASANNVCCLGLKLKSVQLQLCFFFVFVFSVKKMNEPCHLTLNISSVLQSTL